MSKGVHVGVKMLRQRIQKVSAKGACFALKMDLRHFFDSVDHLILKKLLKRTIKDEKFLFILDLIIDSFQSGYAATGPPLGNVTSQLFANLYLHELDLFVKHTLREPYYLRYCDDFIFLSHDKEHLITLLKPFEYFLNETLHLKRTSLRKLHQGIDFVGYASTTSNQTTDPKPFKKGFPSL